MSPASRDVFQHKLGLALHRSVVSDEALQEVLRLVADRFRCLSAALIYIDEGHPGATVEAGHGAMDATARRRYREDFAKIDPAPLAMARLAVGEATATDHIFDIEDDAFRRFREEFYYPLGHRGAMGGPVVKAEGRFGVLAVQRGADRAAFSHEETADFARLVPLVASALALRRKFFELESSAEKLRSALEEVSVAVIILHSDGRMRHANRLARHFLERQDGLLLTRSGRLKLTNGIANRSLQALFARKPIDDSIIRVPRDGHATPYVLRVMSKAGDIMVKVCDPMSTSAEAEAILSLVFEMPPSSARLAAALLNGVTVAEYATQARLSQNTVKFHLKNAFSATATKRQSDLIRVASAVVSGVGN